MKKPIKILLGVVIALVALPLVIVLTLPFWINPLVKAAASVGGPKVLGVPVSVGRVSLSPLSGSMTISKIVGEGSNPSCSAKYGGVAKR